MDRRLLLALASLSLFLLAIPLTPEKPGLPGNLKADEPAYYLMAQSLAQDHDLRCDLQDVQRVFTEFPFGPVRNLILKSDDGWKTAHFGKPYVYPLLAAPFVRLWGANGMVFLNMLLLVGMVWMGAFYLVRSNPGWLAGLFSAGFFLLSTGFAYVFWLQPEVFNMAAVAACLFLGLRPREGSLLAPEHSGWLPDLAAASGAALALAAYNKPMLAAIALPILWQQLRARRWRDLRAWCLGAATATALLCVVAMGLTGHLSAYVGGERLGVTVCEPGKMPFAPVASVAPAAPAATATAIEPPAAGPSGPPTAAAPAVAAPSPSSSRINSWGWLLRVPTIVWGELFENFGYFLWGRHTGVLWYLPFSSLCLLLFLLHTPRRTEGWMLLLSMALVALFFLILVPFNWHGGGGFLGNRYFVGVYPGFLFLVSQIRPRLLVPLGYAAGGLLLGPLLLSPWGAPVQEATLQAHVRNFPYPLFPLELSLKQVPGYLAVNPGGLRIQGRRDLFLPQGDELWLRGSSRVELWLSSAQPLLSFVFEVKSPAPASTIEMDLSGAREVVRLEAAGTAQRVELHPRGPSKLRSQNAEPVYAYRLLVSSKQGRNQTWVRHSPPESCPGFAFNESANETFFTGAALLYLGDGGTLKDDVYALEWGGVNAPHAVTAGAIFAVQVEVWNRSSTSWRGAGAARVSLSYHWKNAAGEIIERDGLRTGLPGEVPPGGRVAVSQQVRAPQGPGTYTLELDPVFEHVAWFSERNGGQVFRIPVEVVLAASLRP